MGHRKQRRLGRKTNFRETRKVFLIVCEGTKTEPNYFKGFKVPADVEIHIEGTGHNTLSLVKEAIKLRDSGDYDAVWCVFDKDSFPAKNINSAFTLASKEGVNIAFSNEAFEIWYLLHFDYFTAGLSRAAYRKKLSKYLGAPYQKNGQDMYERLQYIQKTAIRNAKKLMKIYKKYSPASANPSTTVYKLVEELNKHSR